jgi:integrative and conjugative element protein (TIGR02256 family)
MASAWCAYQSNLWSGVQTFRLLAPLTECASAPVNWSIRISSHAVHGMRYHRRRNLPNETGGVALGRIDSNRKIIYVATILASPPDSVQWPTAYIRGAQGLEEAVGRLNRLAGGDICYVGEWHSHPEGHSSEPSEDDRKAHRGITHEMGRAGLPGLVLIQGTAQKPHIMFDLE